MKRLPRRAALGSIERLFRSGTAVGLSDGQLLERFTTRHDEAAEAAFAALVDRHGPMVLSVCRRILIDAHSADDAFQATFLILVRRARNVRKRDSLASWLFGVALRVSKHSRSAAARRRDVEQRAHVPSQSATGTTDGCREIWEEVDRLPKALRAAVVHCYLEGLTHEQAATRLGWPVGTVRSRLARARDRLRGRLAGQGYAPSVLVIPSLTCKSTLPFSLVESTTKAAMLIAARDALEAGLVSATAATLTEGVLRSMFITKPKLAAAVLATAGAIIAGAGVRAYQETSPRREPPPPPAAAIAASDDEETDDDAFDRYADEVENLLEAARNSHSNNDRRGLARTVRKLRGVTSTWDDVVSGNQAQAGPRPRSTAAAPAPTPSPSPAARPRRPAEARPAIAPVPPQPPTPAAPLLAPPSADAPPAPPAAPPPPSTSAGAPRAPYGPAGGMSGYGGMRMGMPGGGYGSPAGSESRLQEVERKLDRILRMLEGPGQGQNLPRPGGARGGPNQSNSSAGTNSRALGALAPQPGQSASSRALGRSGSAQPGEQPQPRPAGARGRAIPRGTDSPDELPPDSPDDESSAERPDERPR